VIADVSDKGLAASLYMAVTRTLLRAAAEGFDSPAKTLEHVNTLLLNNSQDGLFVTTFYGILSLDDGLLSYTSAGHNPPLIIRHEHNDVITLEKGGIAIGALPDISLSDHQITINPGDCLVLYTDGVTEAFNLKDQMYGESRLIRLLGNLIGESASSVLEAVDADLAQFRGGAPLSDDTTMLAICRSRLLGNDHGEFGTA
jgi:sigma-B regulation protein RsbU (phosphoserine phosphatase)